MLMRWLLFFLALIVGLAQSQETSHDKAVAQKGTTVENNITKSAKASPAIKIGKSNPVKEAGNKPETHADEKLNLDRKLVEYTGELSAFTMGLVIATAVLALIAIWQGVQLKNTVDLGRAEFLASHRPKLAIRRVSINTAKGSGIPDVLGVQFIVANVGDTPARIVGLSAKLWFPESTENLPPVPPYGESTYPRLTIGPGESPPLTHNESAELEGRFRLRVGFVRAKTMGGGTDDGPDLLFIGYVDYEDQLKRRRRTAFLRRYNFVTERFDPINHPDYEYQD